MLNQIKQLPQLSLRPRDPPQRTLQAPNLEPLAVTSRTKGRPMARRSSIISKQQAAQLLLSRRRALEQLVERLLELRSKGQPMELVLRRQKVRLRGNSSNRLGVIKLVESG